MTKKKYIILFTIIIILLLIFSGIFSDKQEEPISENASEKTSQESEITEDVVNFNIPKAKLKISKLTLFSPDFLNLESIPSKYTCDGENINPNLEISGVDLENAKSLVLIMDDLDAPDGVWDHWIRFNIPVATTNINSGEILEGIAGEGTGGNLDYSGPCPPEGKHSYTFKLYTLDTELTLSEGSSKTEVEEGMQDHILQSVELTGAYERKIDLIEEKKVIDPIPEEEEEVEEVE